MWSVLSVSALAELAQIFSRDKGGCLGVSLQLTTHPSNFGRPLSLTGVLDDPLVGFSVPSAS